MRFLALGPFWLSAPADRNTKSHSQEQNALKCSSELAATGAQISQKLVELEQAMATKSAAMKCKNMYMIYS